MSESAPSEHRDRPVVLIANDQEWTARAVESILDTNGYRVVRAHTATAALAAALDHDPDLVILDLQLPDFSGIDLCRRLRENPRFGTALPIIITTAGPSGRQQRLKAYEAGAWEFYGQPLDAEALLHKMAVYGAASVRVRALREQQTIDESSGCYTPRGLRRRLEEMLADARRHGRGIGCIIWKGTGAVSSELARAAKEVARSARNADVIGQVEDGEIVLAASELTPAGADVVAERIRHLLVAALDASREQIRSSVVLGAADQLATSADALLDRLRGAVAV